jgi:hypothetical protein
MKLARFAARSLATNAVNTAKAPAAGSAASAELLPAFSKPQRELLLQQKTASDPSYSAQQRTMIDRILHAPIASTEGQIRKDLSIAHRLMARFGYDDLIWNRESPDAFTCMAEH